MDDGHKFNFSEITDQIIIGSDLCQGGICLIHGSEFEKLGIGFEINLSAENNELPPKNVHGYLWLPTPDRNSSTDTQLHIGTATLNQAIKAGEKVYVHCRNGHGRSPALVAAYLIRYQGLSVDQAIEQICDKRPEIHIEDTQRQALEIFAKNHG